MSLDFKNLSISKQIALLCLGFFILAVINFFVVNHYQNDLKEDTGKINAIRKLQQSNGLLSQSSKEYISGRPEAKEILNRAVLNFEKELATLFSMENQFITTNDTTTFPANNSDEVIANQIRARWNLTRPYIDDILFEPALMDTLVEESKQVPANDSLNSYTTEISKKVLSLKNTKVIRASNFIQKQSGELSPLLEKWLSDKMAEGENKHEDFTYMLLLFLLLETTAIIIILLFIHKQILEPLQQIKENAESVAQGNLAETIDYAGDDEIGQALQSIGKITRNIKNATVFVNRIEEGMLEADFEGVEEGDVNPQSLEGALLNMRRQMKKLEEEDHQRKWTTEGLAKFVDILRSRDNSVQELGDEIISNLVKYTHSNQGGLYILNDENEKEIVLELISLYAFDTKKYDKRSYRPGEGLVGQTFQEKETTYLLEIPEDYISITSGLGGSNPTSILLIPLRINDIIYGVLELASFNEYKDFEIEFVEKLGESIASTIAGVKNNQQTKLLLEESQLLAEKMQAQEEEMRQNMEELQATQEQLERQMKENTGTQETLTREKIMLDALLGHLPDYIYFKDLEGKFTRVSQSMDQLTEHDSVDLIGKSNEEVFTPGEAEVLGIEEEKIIKTGKGFINNLTTKTRENGTVQWLLTSKFPFYDKEQKCIGTFGAAKDVTEIKISPPEGWEEMKEVEEALRQNLEELEITQEQLDQKLKKSEATFTTLEKVVKILTISESGTIIDINHAAREVLKLKKNQIIDKDVTTLTGESVLTNIIWDQAISKPLTFGTDLTPLVNIYADSVSKYIHLIWI